MSKLKALMEHSTRLEVVQEDDTNKLKLMSDEDEISSVDLPSGGGRFDLAPPTGANAVAGDEEITIKWSDPPDTELEGVALAKWKKTILIRKEGSSPENAADGTVVVEELIRNQYASTGYVDKNVQNDITYYYGVFPQSTSGSTNITVVVSATPQAVYPPAATELSVTTKKGSATVTYTKPSSGVTRCDLVYKENSIPSSSDDGTKISNYASGTEITGLTDGATYHFVIYTYNEKERETASSSVSAVIKSTLTVPTQKGTLTYNGSSQEPSWDNYDPSKLTMSGETSGENAKTYTAKFTPKGDYIWEDTNDASEKEVQWTIEKAPIVDVPVQNNTLTYTGSPLQPTWTNYTSDKLTISGDTSKTDAGEYTATFTPTSNYKWSDGSASKTASWSIGRATITATPAQSNTLTYTGSALVPQWSNYTSSQLTISGSQSEINAGSYTVTFTPTKNYKWSDNSIDGKQATWKINKAAGSLTLGSASVEINLSKSNTATVTVTREGDGVVSANTTAASYATASVNSAGNQITITGVAKGSATINVTVAEGTNHLAVTTAKTISVTVKTLEIVTPGQDPTVDQILAMVEAAYNDDIKLTDYWNVGDTFTFDIGSMTNPNTGVSGAPDWAAQKLTFSIVAFDHHPLKTAIKGHTKAVVTLQARECLNSTNNYNQNDSMYVNGDSAYDMTFTKWSNLQMRTWLNGVFFQALPAGLRGTGGIKETNHNRLTQYNAKTTESVTDKVFLPSYPEVFGNAAYGNYLSNAVPAGEEGTQWPYYVTTSNRIKYRNNNGASNGTACHWWEGSASSYYSSSSGYLWCLVNANGTALRNYGGSAFGLAPAFCL